MSVRDEVPNKHSLYTQAERKPRTLTIECSACREETRVSYLELAALMFPVHFHVPLVKYHHSWMRCPSCGRRTWVRLHLDR
jgi:uncharacterized protein with PIN domain